jgi:hypothetical protein
MANTFAIQLLAQKDTLHVKADTFFLSKKRGLMGKLGKAMERSSSDDNPVTSVVKTENQFSPYEGRVIRNIELVQVGLGGYISNPDTAKINFLTKLGDAFHRTTTFKTIKNNLFFEEGDTLVAALLADNAKFLRQLVYLQDLNVMVLPTQDSTKVDVLIISKDVFSIGGSAQVYKPTSGEVVLSEDNLGGRGNKLAARGFYDADRNNPLGLGGEFIKRNLGGSFADIGLGYLNYAPSLNNYKNQETFVYAGVNRQLVSAYSSWTFSALAAHHFNQNMYEKSDSFYKKELQYDYYNVDTWIGYNIGAKKNMYQNLQSRYRRLVALRMVNQHFNQVPDNYLNTYNYLYANITGVLASFTLFQQDYYKAKYIYGFGRNEDVPEGNNLSFIGGWTNKQNSSRGYVGIDVRRFYFSNNNYVNYTLLAGSYIHDKAIEDANILAEVDYFTHLRTLSKRWMQRTYFSANITGQFNTVLNPPLLLNSIYGMQSYSNTNIPPADGRATAKVETVFYNKWAFVGFKFAPFLAGNFTLMKPIGEDIGKSDGYTSIGGGIRGRNENLVFGTFELRVSYFPRPNVDMTNWKIEFNTDLQFKFTSQFVNKPDFAVVN